MSESMSEVEYSSESFFSFIIRNHRCFESDSPCEENFQKVGISFHHFILVLFNELEQLPVADDGRCDQFCKAGEIFLLRKGQQHCGIANNKFRLTDCPEHVFKCSEINTIFAPGAC